MKRSLPLIFALALGLSAGAQVVFTSSFESWTGTDPTGWIVGGTNIEADSVNQVTGSSQYGNNAAQLINTQTSHKRLVTSAVSITNGQSYNVKYWVKGQGDIRAGLWDGGTGVTAYQYASYNTINSSTWTLYTQTIIADSTSATAGFILSVKATVGPTHIQVDSFAVEAVSTTNYSVYQLQYTTAGTGDSPYNNQTVSTGGIVTAVDLVPSATGYWIQSGTGPWTGIYVFDGTNAPSLAIGDSVTMTALVSEFNSLTELKNVANLVKVSSGNTVVVNPISTGDANIEDYEGVLVKVSSATCTAGNGTGNQFTVNDGTGAIFVDDEMYLHTATLNAVYDVTGPAHFAFSERKIEPRMASDVVIVTGIKESAGSGPSVIVYPNPSAGLISIKAVEENTVIEVMDLTGKILLTEKTAQKGNFTLNLKKAGAAEGAYFIRLKNDGEIRTARVILQN